MTGDRPYEPHGAALAQAMREALLNAVRHGGPPVHGLRRDRARPGSRRSCATAATGFDLDTVPDDRLGVRQSILGRMERHGGTARVRRRDDGTEVELPAATDRRRNVMSQPTTTGGGATAADPCGSCSSTTTGCSAPACAPS